MSELVSVADDMCPVCKGAATPDPDDGTPTLRQGYTCMSCGAGFQRHMTNLIDAENKIMQNIRKYVKDNK